MCMMAQLARSTALVHEERASGILTRGGIQRGVSRAEAVQVAGEQVATPDLARHQSQRLDPAAGCTWIGHSKVSHRNPVTLANRRQSTSQCTMAINAHCQLAGLNSVRTPTGIHCPHNTPRDLSSRVRFTTSLAMGTLLTLVMWGTSGWATRRWRVLELRIQHEPRTSAAAVRLQREQACAHRYPAALIRQSVSVYLRISESISPYPFDPRGAGPYPSQLT